MSLFGNYDTPGKGIPKAPMEKKGIFKFFEIYGRRIWKLVQVNMIFVLACIPVVTFGPAVAGMTKVARNYSQERNAFIWTDFWTTFKKCFKQFLHTIFSEKNLYEHLLKSIFKYAIANIECDNYEVSMDDFTDLLKDFIKSDNNIHFENVTLKLFNMR